MSTLEPLLAPTRVARLLGVEAETLASWRRKGYGPRWYRIGKKIKYAEVDLRAWMTAQSSLGDVSPTGLPDVKDGPMTTDQLTIWLVENVMHWRVGPDRFLMDRRRWLPRWKFQPAKHLKDAIRLLEAAAPQEYSFGQDPNGDCCVKVRVGASTVQARDKSKPLAICRAVAAAVRTKAELSNR